MSVGFLDHMRVVRDHRIAGMVTYPLDEILLATLVGVVCGADDWEGVEEIAAGALNWLRSFLPFASGIPTAQTLRKVFRLLDPQALQRGFAAWAASLRTQAREVIAVDGKTLRGSKTSADGKGALHLVSAYATEAGLVLAQRAVDGKSNEITATTSRARLCRSTRWGRKRRSLGASPTRARIMCSRSKAIKRACMRTRRCSSPIRFAPPTARRAPTPTPAMAGSKSVSAAPPRPIGSPNAIPTGKVCVRLAAVTARRIDKKTGGESLETRYYITSLEPDPKVILAAVRAHWGIENNLHWTMDVTFDEDRCRTRKDASPLNFAVVRHTAYNFLKADKSRGSLRRKRLVACIDPAFRTKLFAA